VVIERRLFTDTLSPLRGSGNLTNLTQGSPGLALGLTLAAAPQLVETHDSRRVATIGLELLGNCSAIKVRVPCGFLIYERVPASNSKLFCAR
jgi:UDP-N-acetylmuramyl pentapeptide phosphotransferase/UDP-N-acetylglucosamine-1-phosphate transferase